MVQSRPNFQGSFRRPKHVLLQKLEMGGRLCTKKIGEEAARWAGEWFERVRSMWSGGNVWES